MTSASHEKVEENSANGEILRKGFKLYYKISFRKIIQDVWGGIRFIQGKGKV